MTLSLSKLAHKTSYSNNIGILVGSLLFNYSYCPKLNDNIASSQTNDVNELSAVFKARFNTYMQES